MALMLAKLYTALREAGADDDKAREAAEEVASFENRLTNVEASLMVLKWMVGFNLILTVAIVGMLFFVLANELAANAAATTDALFNPHPNAAEMPRQSPRKTTGVPLRRPPPIGQLILYHNQNWRCVAARPFRPTRCTAGR